MPSEKFIERLAVRGGDEISVDDFDDEEFWQFGSAPFCLWFSHHDYICGLTVLRPPTL